MSFDLSPLDILNKLIRFRSITPHHDGAIDYIADILSANGFDVYVKDFGPNNIRNLYASRSPILPAVHNICFAGHVDVVPPSNDWTTDPFSPVILDGKVYGRGAVDMKGALACMIAATVNFLNRNSCNIYHTISFLVTSDEEGEAIDGTNSMLRWMEQNNHKIDFAVVGEPTSESLVGDTVKIGRRGSINFHLTVHGIQGHVAYQDLAVNPNKIIIDILHALINIAIDDGNELFLPSNLEVTSIDTGNIIANVIPQTSSARFNIRYNNEHNANVIIQLIHDVIRRFSESFKLDFTICAEPFLSESSEYTRLFRESINSVTGIYPRYSTSGGTSDARFISNYCPVIECGLMSTLAHKIDEYVEIRDLQILYDVYYRFMRDCSRSERDLR